jgi:hypothetical protein
MEESMEKKSLDSTIVQSLDHLLSNLHHIGLSTLPANQLMFKETPMSD